MIAKKDLLELQAIIAEEYNRNLSLGEIEKIGNNLISFFSLVLKNKNQNDKSQSSGWQKATY